MKLLVMMVTAGILMMMFSMSAFAHHWVCEYCGNGVSASNHPQPGNSCSRNPHGKYHSWVIDDGDGKSHHWTCAYCGWGANSTHMPHPSNSCAKNPDDRFHKWVMDD